MKRMRKLLSALLALTLVFCSLSAGMTALAAEEDIPEPFASFTVDGKAVVLNHDSSSYDVVGYTKTSAQVKWTLNSGWKVTDAYYYDYSGNKSKKINLKSGDKVKVPKDESVNISVSASYDQNDQYDFGFFSVTIYQGKARLLADTIWMSSGKNWLSWSGFSGSSEVVSIKSSKPGVLKVKKGGQLWDCTMTPKSTGKSKITVKVKINGKEKTFSAEYTVKKYPNPLSSLKVDGKSVDLKKNKFYFSKKVNKNKTKFEFKASKGWKVKSCAYYNESKGKTIKLKSGDSIDTKASRGVYLLLTKGKDTFWYDVELLR